MQDIPVPHGKRGLGFGINQGCCLGKTRDFWLLKFHQENSFHPLPTVHLKRSKHPPPPRSVGDPPALSCGGIFPFHPFIGMDASPWQLPEAGSAFSLYFCASLTPSVPTLWLQTHSLWLFPVFPLSLSHLITAVLLDSAFSQC